MWWKTWKFRRSKCDLIGSCLTGYGTRWQKPNSRIRPFEKGNWKNCKGYSWHVPREGFPRSVPKGRVCIHWGFANWSRTSQGNEVHSQKCICTTFFNLMFLFAEFGTERSVALWLRHPSCRHDKVGVCFWLDIFWALWSHCQDIEIVIQMLYQKSPRNV